MARHATPGGVPDGAALLLHLDSLSAPPGYSLSTDPAGGIAILSPVPGSASRLPHGPFSFCVRVRAPEGAGSRPMVLEQDSRGTSIFSLSLVDSVLIFELFTDYRQDPLRLTAPLGGAGVEPWHEVVGRYSGPRAELFVDGALVDEEWPLGAVGGAGGGRLVIGGTGSDGPGGAGEPSAAIQGFVEHFAAWDRALEDNDVQALCGRSTPGAGGRARTESGPLQYGRAHGGGNVGDCFPFFHDGVYHFYYLFDRRHHGSKFGLGAHQWAHASSRDLIRWEHHPMAVPITEEWEGSICTGSVFFHERTWYAFYATRRADRSEHLSLALGADGISFTKVEPNPFASPRPPYRHGPFRDPHVFEDPRTGLFHMLVTAELADPPVAGRGGCLAHLTSTDLRGWEQQEPFLVTGYADQPECSELFEWHGWYYLVFSHFGVAHYRMARGPFGPWIRPRVDSLDGPLARVMKSAPFTGDRRIGAFFLAEGAYAGRAVFREIIQNPDGTLGSSWPPEMIPRAGPALAVELVALDPGIRGDLSHLSIESPQGFSAGALAGLPRRYLFSARVRFSGSCGTFGVGVRGRGNFQDALILELAPSRRKVGWRHAGRPSWQEEETAALYEVDDLDRPFTLELVVLDDILDLRIDGRRTLINRAEMGDGDRLFFFCHECAVDFDGIVVRPLLDS